MYNTRRVNKDLVWVGANDRRLSLFEGVYSVPKGVSYNSYLLLDEKTVLFDTVDKSCANKLLENLEHELSGKTLDYIVVHHMEPDHSATLKQVIQRYSDVKIVANSKIKAMIGQFFGNVSDNFVIVNEGDKMSFGEHEFVFINAPMVHWPEVMMSYDLTDGTLFSADAFGVFGALNGALFADEVDFFNDYLSEARRYYTNIVGKYGQMVVNALKKVSSYEIKTVCPLHGFVWRKDFDKYLEKYLLWAQYLPEEKGVMIAYGSIYGNTENAAEILSSYLIEHGIKTEMFDVSTTAAAEIVSSSFKWSNLVFASSTYNAGVFVNMEEVLRDLASHNLQNRKVSYIENGSWAPIAAKKMEEILSSCKNIEKIGEIVSIMSSLTNENLDSLKKLANEIVENVKA